MEVPEVPQEKMDLMKMTKLLYFNPRFPLCFDKPESLPSISTVDPLVELLYVINRGGEFYWTWYLLDTPSKVEYLDFAAGKVPECKKENGKHKCWGYGLCGENWPYPKPLANSILKPGSAWTRLQGLCSKYLEDRMKARPTAPLCARLLSFLVSINTIIAVQIFADLEDLSWQRKQARKQPVPVFHGYVDGQPYISWVRPERCLHCQTLRLEQADRKAYEHILASLSEQHPFDVKVALSTVAKWTDLWSPPSLFAHQKQVPVWLREGGDKLHVEAGIVGTCLSVIARDRVRFEFNPLFVRGATIQAFILLNKFVTM